MSKNLIMLGLPGVGKGTNADVLANDFKLPHISTGDIFRNAMSQGTPLGKKAKEFMDAGDLVPDEITNGIVAERLNESDIQDAQGFILDGYPRNPQQAIFLNEFLSKVNQKIDAVIYLEAPQNVVIERMKNRAISSGRSDDTQEVIQHRIEVALAETMPLVDFYKEQGNLLSIDATRDIDTVYTSVKNAVENI
jgi:adenylate kinase